MRLGEELKTLNLIYRSTYCHQPFQGSDLVQEASTLKIT